MKSCAYCGKENEDAAISCGECGTQEFKSVSNEPRQRPNRRSRVMFAIVLNFILALGAALMTIPTIRHAHQGLQLGDVIYLIVAPCWLLGSIGLLFRNRLAWLASILGASTMLCSSIAMIGWAIVMSPAAQDPTDGVGYAMIFGIAGMALSLPLVIALLSFRKHWREMSEGTGKRAV